MSVIPEKLKRKRKTNPFKEISCQLTVLGTSMGKIYVGSKDGSPTGYCETLRVTNLNNPDDEVDLPILRPVSQVSLYNANSFEEIAERLRRLESDIEISAKWIKKQVEMRMLPLYFCTRWAFQGYRDDKKNTWLTFKSYKQANELDERRFNAWLKSQGSVYRIVRKRVVLHEA